MGSYLNPSSERFQTSLRSRIYLDRMLLIAQINQSVRTQQKFICVSRPRRFDKLMVADRLSAYYGWGEDTSVLFGNLKVTKAESFQEHLNKYDLKGKKQDVFEVPCFIDK